jgi:hypothetical protein
VDLNGLSSVIVTLRAIVRPTFSTQIDQETGLKVYDNEGAGLFLLHLSGLPGLLLSQPARLADLPPGEDAEHDVDGHGGTAAHALIAVQSVAAKAAMHRFFTRVAGPKGRVNCRCSSASVPSRARVLCGPGRMVRLLYRLL